MEGESRHPSRAVLLRLALPATVVAWSVASWLRFRLYSRREQRWELAAAFAALLHVLLPQREELARFRAFPTPGTRRIYLGRGISQLVSIATRMFMLRQRTSRGEPHQVSRGNEGIALLGGMMYAVSSYLLVRQSMAQQSRAWQRRMPAIALILSLITFGVEHFVGRRPTRRMGKPAKVLTCIHLANCTLHALALLRAASESTEAFRRRSSHPDFMEMLVGLGDVAGKEAPGKEPVQEIENFNLATTLTLLPFTVLFVIALIPIGVIANFYPLHAMIRTGGLIDRDGVLELWNDLLRGSGPPRKNAGAE